MVLGISGFKRKTFPQVRIGTGGSSVLLFPTLCREGRLQPARVWGPAAPPPHSVGCPAAPDPSALLCEAGG